MKVGPISQAAPPSAGASADDRAFALLVGVLLLGAAVLAIATSPGSVDEDIRPVPAVEKEPAPRPGRRF